MWFKRGNKKNPEREYFKKKKKKNNFLKKYDYTLKNYTKSEKAEIQMKSVFLPIFISVHLVINLQGFDQTCLLHLQESSLACCLQSPSELCLPSKNDALLEGVVGGGGVVRLGVGLARHLVIKLGTAFACSCDVTISSFNVP